MLAPLGVGLFLLLFGLQISPAQLISEYQVKAAYLYNFAKFADWPPTAFTSASDPIRLCVLNDQPFQLQLTQIVKDKSITGRPIVAVPIRRGADSKSRTGTQLPCAIHRLDTKCRIASFSSLCKDRAS